MNSSLSPTKKENLPEWLFWVGLLIVWISIQGFLYSRTGVKTGVDTSFYMNNALNILNLNIPEGRAIWYSGYILFLAFFIGVGVSLKGIVFVQIFISTLAAIFMYKIAMKISGNKNSGFAAVLLFVIWIKIHEWNMFIYTESLFTSFSIILFWCLLTINTPKDLSPFILLLLFTVLIRPTGLGLFLAVAAYFILSLFQRNKPRISFPIAFVAITFSIVLIGVMLESYDLIESYAKGEIIYPNISLGISTPQNLTLPDNHHLHIVQLVIFAFENPIYFLKISSLKLFLFVFNVKPYFSDFHNACLIIFLLPIYFFAVKGYRQLAHTPLKGFFLIFITVQGLTVTLTTENWDGRFLIPVLPFIFLLASMGLNRISLSYRSWKL